MNSKHLFAPLAVLAATVATASWQHGEMQTLRLDRIRFETERQTIEAQIGDIRRGIAESVEQERRLRERQGDLDAGLARAIETANHVRRPGPVDPGNWNEAEPYVDVPKRMLTSLRVTGYAVDERSGPSLSASGAAVLGLSRQEYSDVQGALNRARERYLDRERELLQLSDDHPSNTADWQNRVTYRVPAYAAESERYAADYRADVESILGAERTALLLQYAGVATGGSSDYRDFTRLGRNGRGLTFGQTVARSGDSVWQVAEWADGS